MPSKKKFNTCLQNRKRIAVTIFSCALLVACGSDESTPKKAQSSAGASGSDAALIDQINKNVSSANIKAMTGEDKFAVGGKLASITVPMEKEEKRFLDEATCLDERECFGEKRFEKFIFKKYPDIAKVKFNPSPEIASDPDSKSMYRTMFIHSLYFAKQLKLADGQTLFDFLTKCSKTVSSSNSASMDDKKGFYMMFFPVLKQATGNDYEAQIVLNRSGDKIAAGSPMFSSSILTNPDFMNKHGLQCAK